MKLSDLKKKSTAKVLSINTDENTNSRLFDMGLKLGATVTLEQFAPLGDPIKIRINHFSLLIRKKLAEKIEVEVIK